MNKEIWKDVIGYEGLYQVSNHGRVKSYPRNGTKGGILKPGINSRGYFHVALYKNNKQKISSIHRLVALHFVDNPENKPQVNHIDGDKLNNHVSNLEWCTASENIQHAFNNGLGENVRNKKYCSKKVYCKELNKIFESIMDAERQFGINNSSISKCCRGLIKSAGKKVINYELTKLTWKYI